MCFDFSIASISMVVLTESFGKLFLEGVKPDDTLLKCSSSSLS